MLREDERLAYYFGCRNTADGQIHYNLEEIGRRLKLEEEMKAAEAKRKRKREGSMGGISRFIRAVGRKIGKALTRETSLDIDKINR